MIQAPPPTKVAASIVRLFGPHASVDTLHVDSAAVLRISAGDSLLGFAQVGSVIGKDQPITFLVAIDRKSTRLNSSHSQISYPVFCLKKKNTGGCWSAR